MKIAVLSDIHSNLTGLQAVLRDIEARGINRVYCAGDLVGYGSRPNEVIALLRDRQIPTVMGNYDDAVGFMRFICGCDYKDEAAMKLAEKSMLWTKEHTSEENKAWLRELPQQLSFTEEGLRFLIVHGSPRQLNEYLFENTPDDYLNQLLAENTCDVLICGHTHLPYYKELSNGHVINVGSAGKPKHGNPNLTYGILDIQEGGRLQVEFVQVAYDFARAARDIEEAGLPAEFARAIRTGTA